MKAQPRHASKAEPAIESTADLGYDPSRPSKSQRKRDMTALQDLGEELVELTRERLMQLALPEALEEAVLEAQRIRSHEGRRRQLQYIGKLMRSVEVEPIQAQLAVWRGTSRAAAAALHHLEHWRERLLEDDAALAEFTANAGPLEPATLTALRSSVRMARQERAAEREPRHYRELFRLLKEILTAARANP
jgi:ribosome-associated protein